MRIFVVSDTHDCPISELKLIAGEAKKRQCDCIIHCGDLEDGHFGHPSLGHLPIWVFPTEMNEKIPPHLPDNWHVLQDDDRQIIRFGKIAIYVNHYLGVEVLRANLGIPTPEAQTAELIEKAKTKYGQWAAAKIQHKLWGWFSRRKHWPKSLPFQIVEKIKQEFPDVHYCLFGHSHHQFFHVNYDVALVNPGAFGKGFDGQPKRSFATIDTKTWDITFSKVLA